MLKGLSRFGKPRKQSTGDGLVPNPEADGNNPDGTISVLNREVFVSEPREGGAKASLLIPENSRVSVSIDGQSVNPGQYELTGREQVSLVPMHIEPHCETDLRHSPDKMELIVSIELHPGVLYQPENSPPVNELSLHWTETEMQAVPPSEVELLKVLEDSKYAGEIDRRAVSELAAASKSLERTVLRGTKVYPGKPEEVREVPLPAPDYADPLQRRMKLQAVQSGTVVGVVDEAVPPRPGKDVFGQDVPFKRVPRSRLPDFGPGVKRIDNKIYATRAGRLVFTQRMIDVIPIVELNRLTPKEGQIVFDGDVTVYGDVEDGSLIKATGMVQVRGGVYGSTIAGERGVLIGGHCVKTKVYAGWAKDLATETFSVVNETLDRMERYLKDVNRVLQDAREKLGNEDERQLHVLPAAVLDKYHTALPRQLHSLVEQYVKTKQHNLGKRLEPVIRLIQAHWIGPKLKAITSENAVQLFNQLQNYSSYLETSLTEDTAPAEIGTVTSSTIDAAGMVTVAGKGTYASHIFSGKSIEIKGFARGGELKAVESVSVRELGSPSGTETKVTVSQRDGLIKVETRHPNTLLEVGGNVNRNLTEELHVRFTDKMRL